MWLISVTDTILKIPHVFDKFVILKDMINGISGIKIKSANFTNIDIAKVLAS